MTGFLNDTPVQGIDPRIDELINDRLERIQRALGELYENRWDFEPAYAHMAIEVGDVVVNPGETIGNYEINIVNDRGMTSDLVAGTIASDSSHPGAYHIGLSGNLDGVNNTQYTLKGYVDGQATETDIQVNFGGNVEQLQIGWSGIVYIPLNAVMEFRLVSSDPPGRALTIHEFHWSIHRVADQERIRGKV